MAFFGHNHQDISSLKDRELMEQIFLLQKRSHRNHTITMVLWIFLVLLPIGVIVAGAVLASSFVQNLDKFGLSEHAEEAVQLVSDLTGVSYKLGQLDVEKINRLLDAGDSLPQIEQKLDLLLESTSVSR